MPEYQLEIKQVVDYPRCRIDGISYTVYLGEWICSVKELTKWFRTRLQHQAVSILEELQKNQLISYLILDRGKAVKYKVRAKRKWGFSFFPCLQRQNGLARKPVPK